MKYYVGIDLGTTNSAICLFDGKNTRILKSPDGQGDVTPSAIYMDRRGNKYYGSKAYNMAPKDPENSATLFKRFMGTTQKLIFKNAKKTLTPEECSAEILKTLYGYLPEEIRTGDEIATVITVPAAFNQMKKDATLKAANLAGIGKVSLMQEPVAAIMAIMRITNKDGIFLVYDLGGGTFDVSIAENIGGKVNLLDHGGIEMCGGRDIDRLIYNNVTLPWIKNKFNLPVDFQVNPKYKTFIKMAQWAGEQAKIKLSSEEITTIALDEREANCKDENDEELYLDIDISRDTIDDLIEDIVNETVKCTQEILDKNGLDANSIEKLVFVGGPTNYIHLRERISQELALPYTTEVNPMTAVAEGASIFAESIDWNTQSHNRKASNAVVKDEKLNLTFKYTARVTTDEGKILCNTDQNIAGYTINLRDANTGWDSGVYELKNGLMIKVPLSINGDNVFKVAVKDKNGLAVSIDTKEIVITKTFATISAIPSSSIGVEVIEKLGGSPVLDIFVREGDALPKKGKLHFKSAQTLKAGSSDSINIKLWEGDIISPVTDNQYIGTFKIEGLNLEDGIIPTGADIECDFEMTDPGNIRFEASVPCIGETFSYEKNLYSSEDGYLDLDDVDSIAEDGQEVLKRIDELEEKIDDDRFYEARTKAEPAAEIDTMENCEAEDVQKANNNLLDSKKILNNIRQAHLQEIRQLELDRAIRFYDKFARQHAKPSEQTAFDNMAKTAKRSIERNDAEFEKLEDKLWDKYWDVMFRQSYVIADLYRKYTSGKRKYTDNALYQKLKQTGDKALADGDMDSVRDTLFRLWSILVKRDDNERMFDIANIVRG